MFDLGRMGMTRAACHLCLGLLVLSFLGCKTLGGQPQLPYDPARQIKELSVEFDKKTCDECHARDCRNRIVTSQLRAINLLFNQFERAIAEESGKIGMVGDIMVAAFSGAGTIVGGAHSKSVMAALSAFTGGTQTAIQKNLFYQKSSDVLLGRMRALRKQALVPILAGMQRSFDEYPLSQALLDVDIYVAAGSLQSAIIDIDGATKEQNQQADESIQEVASGTYGPDAESDSLRKIWKPDGHTVDPDHKLRKWMDAHDLKDVTIPDLLNWRKYAAARKEAVKALVRPGDQ
jgi:hypothetical protein